MMRLLKGNSHRHEWQCCFCCHVRTGTIMLGVWHLMLHILALSVIAVIVLHPVSLRKNEDVEVYISQDPILPTPLSEVDKPDSEIADSKMEIGVAYNEPQVSSGETYWTNDSFPVVCFLQREYRGNGMVSMGVLVTFCSFIITLLMVYGAIKGKPSYLMPFFCLQVFDFCISSMSAAGYICYLPFVHQYVAENDNVPMQRELLMLNPQLLSLLVLFFFLGALMIKAYLIGMVWRCYKFLTLRAAAAVRTIHFIDPDVENLLSDFETAMKDSQYPKKELFPAPPPSYNSVVVDLPPTFAEAVGTSRPEAEGVPKGVGGANLQ